MEPPWAGSVRAISGRPPLGAGSAGRGINQARQAVTSVAERGNLVKGAGIASCHNMAQVAG
jgi:hypothetical protein